MPCCQFRSPVDKQPRCIDLRLHIRQHMADHLKVENWLIKLLPLMGIGQCIIDRRLGISNIGSGHCDAF